MFRNFRPLWAEINLDNLDHNIKEIKKILGKNVEYISVIKGNGYGHGAIEVAKVCKENGIEWLAVSLLDEALELRKAGIGGSILVLSYTPENNADTVIRNDLSQMCCSYESAKVLSDAAVKANMIGRIHIKVDTGMGRTGFQPTRESAETVRRICMLPALKIEGIYTHFAAAAETNKDYTYMQFKIFNDFLKMLDERGIKAGIRHAANSPAVVDLPDMYMDGVRPGVLQFGVYPSDNLDKSKLGLKPVMTIKAKIAFVKEVEAGTSIGYGRLFVTGRKSRIATIPVGFGDGYVRRLQGKAKIIVNEKYAPVVGKICMDQCMVDVTDAGDIKPGDEVIIMGSRGDLHIEADYFASALDTGISEVFTMLGRSVPRVYTRNGEIVKVINYLLD